MIKVFPKIHKKNLKLHKLPKKFINYMIITFKTYLTLQKWSYLSIEWFQFVSGLYVVHE